MRKAAELSWRLDFRVAPAGQVAGALGSALLGMAAAGDHREGVAGVIGALLPLRGDRHRAFEDQQAGIELMRVLRVQRIGRHAAIYDIAMALFATIVL